ncbi:hypothetical protein AALB47_23095 [Lachnospiraceae bacterium 54-11]
MGEGGGNMLTALEKSALVKEMVTNAVPEIVKAVKEELANTNDSDQKDEPSDIDYRELVRNAMK